MRDQMNKKEKAKFIKDVYNFLIKEDDEPIFFPDFVSLLNEQYENNRKTNYLDDLFLSFKEKFGRVKIIMSSKYNPEQSIVDIVDDEDEFYVLYFLDKDIYILFKTWRSDVDRFVYWTREYVFVEQVVSSEIKTIKYTGV